MTVADDFVSRHRPTLEGALAAIRDRGYWSAYPESPRAYGEEHGGDRSRGFRAYVGECFPPAPSRHRRDGGSESPYGIELNVSYPHVTATTVDALIAAAQAGMPARRGPRRPRRRVPGDPRPPQCAVARDRARGDAHQWAGVRHGVPSGRPARAGPRSGGHRICLRGDDAASA